LIVEWGPNVRTDLESIPHDRDKAVFSAAGYGARAGFGKRPALLVIDVSYAFTGDTPGEPILDSIKRWRNSCGAESWSPLLTSRS